MNDESTSKFPLICLYDLNIVDHLVHAECEPGVELRHVFLAFAPRHALQSHDAIARGDEDLNVVYEWVLVQNDLNGVGYFVVVVLFMRDDFQAIEHVAAARDPPGQRSGESFVRETGRLAFEQHNPFVPSLLQRHPSADNDPHVAALLRRVVEGLGAIFCLDTDRAVAEGRLLDEGVADVVAYLFVAHPLARRHSEPVHDAAHAWNGGGQFQRQFLGRDVRRFALQRDRVVNLVEYDLDRMLIEPDAWLTLQSRADFLAVVVITIRVSRRHLDPLRTSQPTRRAAWAFLMFFLAACLCFAVAIVIASFMRLFSPERKQGAKVWIADCGLRIDTVFNLD